jgi:anti-sigma factor RsiW
MIRGEMMIDKNSPVTEDELHAYADGELPADRRAAVEAWLASHPDDAARVAGWRLQAETLRSRYGAVAEQPVPERLKLSRIERLAYGWRTWVGIAAAASIAAFLIGGIAGWMARGASASAPSALELFTNQALSAHKLYVAEVRHPIEVAAGEQHLLPWLSRRVGTSLRAPDLASFELKLLGGRLLPGPRGPAALFMYEGPTGERYTLYCSRSTAPSMAMRYNIAGQVAAVYWVEVDIGWVVSGPADRERLLKIAQAIYDQLEQRASPAQRSSAGQLVPRRSS